MTTSLAELLAETLGQALTLSTRRLVTRSGFRTRGFHNSRRFGRLPWESTIERQMLERLDHSWLTTRLEVQAITLRIPSVTDARGFFLYTPDAITLDRHGRLYVLEAKSFDDLQSEDIRSKHRDIRMCLRARDVGYVEISEHDMGPTALQANLQQLWRTGRMVPLTRQKDRARALIERHAPANFAALEDLLGNPRALHALAHGLLTFNVHQALDASTALVTQPNEAIDAALFIYSRPAASAV